MRLLRAGNASAPEHRARRGTGRVGRWLAAGLAALLAGTAMVATSGGVVPAAAMEGASLLLVKTVNGKEAERDLRPGDSVTYRVEFRVNDEDADAPVRVADALPAAFAGWRISGLTAVVGGSPANVTLDLPGVASGPSPATPVEGVLGSTSDALTITVGVAQPVQPGTGNTSGLGMSTRDTGVLEYTITVPEGLAPDDPILRTDLVNTATFTAKAGAQDLSASDTALITVDHPVAVDVVPAKTWSPSGQNYQPGERSTVTIGGTQAANVAASALRLQDPADPALTPDGATSLHPDNPFAYVDFAGFAAPADPTANLPEGATAAEVEVYAYDGTAWSWRPWTEGIADADIAGVRTAYLGAIPPGTVASQGFVVEQRSTHRTTGDSVSGGYRTSNDVRATVEVPGQPAVSKDAEAPFEVAPERIGVTAQKRFTALPDGDETATLTGVTAGDTVGVVLRAINNPAPQSTVLDELSVREPAAGSDERFFGPDLSFAGFDADAAEAAWPAGATGGSIVWTYDDGSTETVTLGAPGSALPDPDVPSGRTVKGFEVAFTGAIQPGAVSEIRYRLATSADEDFVPAGQTAGPFRNTIEVTGQRDGLPEATDDDGATVSLVAPRIDVTIDKRVGPGAVLPGQTVVAQLGTEVRTAGGRTTPTEIVVEDVTSGAGTFWDAFDAARILPPIARPMNAASPATQADLVIEVRDADGEWRTLATNPAEDAPIDVPAGATGLRFTYTNTDGLSQATYVKPNIAFTARETLRSDPETRTSGSFAELERYENVATATGTGSLDDRVVRGEDEDRQDVGIRGTGGDAGPGPGGLWVGKDWAHDSLVSQSGAGTWTTQQWAVTRDGYETVRLQDPAAPTASGAGTVFEAFDLTHIRPIRFGGDAGSGTVDPLLRWDVVTDVQLWNGSDWTSVAAPAGGWMDANGFRGHTLTGAERRDTLGVRLVLAENAEARRAAAEAGDLTAPAVGSGVTASAETRAFRLDWQLRDRARTADGSLKWVKEHGTAFNCAEDAHGCVDNVFGITAIPEEGSPSSERADDAIQLVDDTANVALAKQVRAIDQATGEPVGSPADGIGLVVPNPGELEQADYPRARYTLTAVNASTTPEGARGAMKLGKIRVTDTSSHQLDPAPETDLDGSAFVGRDYAHEVAGPAGNHFDTFALTGIAFGDLPSTIDTAESTVELWLWRDGAADTATFSIAQVRGDAPGGPTAEQLAQTVGVAVTYSGTDPERTGNRIVVGDELVAHLDVQLRQTERLSGEPLVGGAPVTVTNEADARGWDAVVDPDAEPTDRDDAAVELTGAQVRVHLEKDVSVVHGDARDGTLLETDPRAPVEVLLTADANGSTAPLTTLRIEDATPGFWERFQFVGFGDATHPTDADAAAFEVLVDGDWVSATDAVDPAAVRGVAVTFSRTGGTGLFPAGATSWNASWGTATLPVTVQLRDGAAVDWDGGDAQENSATVRAVNTRYGQATDEAEDEVDFSPGSRTIEVVKRAPNDTGTHQVDPLASTPWRLEFTNTGTGYLPITRVTDALPAALSWDGEQPTFTSTAGSGGRSGLSADPADVRVTQSLDGRGLTFEWPEGSRMEPGETMSIGLGLILQPLPTGQRATNEVLVETGVPLDACSQPTGFGQDPRRPGAANECSNTNFVQPRVGTVIGAVKTVNGEPADTLGENLVTGAVDVRSGEACRPGNYLPVGSDYTRNPCASYTAVGATDTWRLEHVNSGTNPLQRLTIVDLLPIPGDRMLAGGASRASTFRPVLADLDSLRVSGLPSGATTSIEVTTNPHACVGADPAGSLWVGDPECADTAANPANVWVPLADFDGEPWEVAGFRIQVDLAAEPLQPAGSVVVEYETVNRVAEQAPEGLQPTLAQFEAPQFAWNQNGVIGWDTAGNRVNLPAAPQRAGVTVKTGELVVSKAVLGEGAENAPESFPVELACTVPSGLSDPERVALDLGEYAHLTVPRDGSVTVPGIPVGADCTASEAGEVGAHGESGRSIAEAPGVIPSEDGRSAEIRIREAQGGETRLELRNTYTLGELVFEKAVSSSTAYAPDAEALEASFAFELVCRVGGQDEEIRRAFELQDGEQHREAGLPEGAECAVTETSAGGALTTVITVAGESTEGASRDGLTVTAGGSHVLVTNLFAGERPPVDPPAGGGDHEGPDPAGPGPEDSSPSRDGGLPVTGGTLAGIAGGALLLLGLGAALLAARRRRDSAAA